MKQSALDALHVAVAEFYAARGASDDKAALAAAERVCARLRDFLRPDDAINAQVSVNRSLWRLAKSGELETYLRTRLAVALAANLLTRPDVLAAIRIANLTAAGEPAVVPKHMHYHTADLRVLAVPIEEDKL